MEKQIETLELEIKVLKERVKELERIENRRKTLSIIKIFISISVIIVIALTIYGFYQKIIDFYNSFPINF